MPPPLSPATAALGARLRARRTELGLSQEAAAERCHVHWTFLGQPERGQRNIALHKLLKLVKGLAIDPGELVRGLEPPDAQGLSCCSSSRHPRRSRHLLGPQGY